MHLLNSRKFVKFVSSFFLRSLLAPALLPIFLSPLQKFAPPTPTATKPMAKVKLGLDKLTPDELVALANRIKAAMTDNANFPMPNPPLAGLGTLIMTLQTKIAAYNSALASADTALSQRAEA